MPFNFTPHFARALPYRPFLAKFATPDQRDRWQRVYDAVALTPEQIAYLQTFRRKMPVLCLSGPWCGDCVAACPVLQRIAEAQPLIDLRFLNRAQNFDAPSAGTAADATPVAAPDPDDIRAKPIGKILVKWGILTPERVEKALLIQEEQKSQGMEIKIGDVMTQLGLITEAQRDRALAGQLGYASLDEADRQVAIELFTCGAPRVPMVVFFSEDMFECARFGDRPLATYRDKAAKAAAAHGASCPTGLFAPPTDLLAAQTADWLAQFERIQLMLQLSPRLMKRHGEA